MSDLILTAEELEAITGYQIATKQLNVLHERGFTRAFIDRNGTLVLERAHYDAVARGQFGRQSAEVGPGKSANLRIFRAA